MIREYGIPIGLTDTRYLKIDQTTPQTVINGFPLFNSGIALGNLTKTRIPFVNTDDIDADDKKLVDDAQLFWDANLKQLVIGVDPNPYPSVTNQLYVARDAINYFTMSCAANSTAGQPYFRLQKARGSHAALETVIAGDPLGGLTFRGYQDIYGAATHYEMAAMKAYVEKDFEFDEFGNFNGYGELRFFTRGGLINASAATIWTMKSDGSLVSGLDGTAGSQILTAGSITGASFTADNLTVDQLPYIGTGGIILSGANILCNGTKIGMGTALTADANLSILQNNSPAVFAITATHTTTTAVSRAFNVSVTNNKAGGVNGAIVGGGQIFVQDNGITTAGGAGVNGLTITANRAATNSGATTSCIGLTASASESSFFNDTAANRTNLHYGLQFTATFNPAIDISTRTLTHNMRTISVAVNYLPSITSGTLVSNIFGVYVSGSSLDAPTGANALYKAFYNNINIPYTGTAGQGSAINWCLYNDTANPNYMGANGAKTGWGTGILSSVGGGTDNLLTPDATIHFDGDNLRIKTDENTPTDLIVECGADKTLLLNETVWNDIQFQISSGRVGVANFPDWDTFTTNTAEYKFAVDDYIDLGGQEIMHDWKEGTAIYPHIHITTDGANTSGSSQYVKFTIYFGYADTGEVWTETSVDVEEEIVNGTADMTHILANGVSIALANNKIGSHMKIRVKRIAATTGTEYPNHIFVTQIGVHYEADTIGSRLISSK